MEWWITGKALREKACWLTYKVLPLIITKRNTQRCICPFRHLISSPLEMGVLWILRRQLWLWVLGDLCYFKMSNSWMRWVILTGKESLREWYMQKVVEHLATLKSLMISADTVRQRYLTELAKELLVLYASLQWVGIIILYCYYKGKSKNSGK